MDSRHCFSCDGSGREQGVGPPACTVCAGKGYWTADDIRRYHAAYPGVCVLSCGEEHVEPSSGGTLAPGEVDSALREARDLLDRYGSGV